MRGGFVALAFGFATLRMLLFGLQLLWLGRRTGPMSLLTASGLALVIFGLGAIRLRKPQAPAEARRDDAAICCQAASGFSG